MKPKKAAVGANYDEEWVPSKMGKVELNRMVAVGVLPDHVTAGWQPASGEPFPMPNTDEESLRIISGVDCGSQFILSCGICWSSG